MMEEHLAALADALVDSLDEFEHDRERAVTAAHWLAEHLAENGFTIARGEV